MRLIKICSTSLFVWLILSALLSGQVENPSLVIKDADGNVYTSHDNSAVMEALAGSLFSMGIEGAPGSHFGLYMSYYKTPYPQVFPNPPPPILLAPPYIPLLVGPAFFLDNGGQFYFSTWVPTDFIPLGTTVDLYFQAYVLDGIYGYRLTNGVTLRIVNSKYKVDLTVGRGNGIDSIFEFGEIKDLDAMDNSIPAGGGPGIENGEPLLPNLQFPFSHYAFKDDETPPEGYPDPTTSIFLNGYTALVPGNAGMNPLLGSIANDNHPLELIHPYVGSGVHRISRDRVCRDNENPYLQHIIAPIFNDAGEKVNDLDIYHFRDRFTGEYGFLAVDVLNNTFYELKGTRKVNDYGGFGSPWEPYVAVSPDGQYMAAVLKSNRNLDIQDWTDQLYVIKLRKNDTWPSLNGLHAHEVKLNPKLGGDDRIVTKIFAESLIFAGAPKPHALFVMTNRYVKGTDPATLEPPVENPASLYKIHAAFEEPVGGNISAKYIDFNIEGRPRAGDGKSVSTSMDEGYAYSFFGRPLTLVINGKDCIVTELNWIASDDYSTLCCRAAGRYAEWSEDTQQWTTGTWAWDVLAFLNITPVEGASNVTNDLNDISGFGEIGPHQGFYVMPFGFASNGRGKVSISPPGLAGFRKVAFVAKPTRDGVEEDLYVAPTDGSLGGVLQPLTSSVLFTGEFQGDKLGRGIYDPEFLSNNALLFFCGRAEEFKVGSWTPCESDLFLYESSLGEFRNLTRTSGEGALPPFSEVGTIHPFGQFKSPDNRYLFFFREDRIGDTKKQRMNLVGVDTENEYQLFDLTGSEFSSGIIPNIAHDYPPNAMYGPEAQNVVLIPKNTGGSYLFFSAKYNEGNTSAYQLFVVDLDYPIGAIPVTNFNQTNEPGMIDNLMIDPTARLAVFSRSNQISFNGSDGAFEKIFMVDLGAGAYLRDLTPQSNYDIASMDGSFRFISPAPELDIPPQFVYVKGEGGNADYATNPTKARIWLYPLEDIKNPNIPSYPMTEEDFFILFNAEPLL